jgi:hypothetical protein
MPDALPKYVKPPPPALTPIGGEKTMPRIDRYV